MAYIIDAETSHRSENQEIVEVKLWGLYLLMGQPNLYSEIIDSSLDRGPVEKNPQKPGRITFRFDARSWESKIKKLLYANRVPVILKSQDVHIYQHARKSMAF